MPTYKVSIKQSSTSSAVEVSRFFDLEQAVAFGFQLHQVSGSRHFISVAESSGLELASFTRLESIITPAPPKPADSGDAPKRSFLGRK